MKGTESVYQHGKRLPSARIEEVDRRWPSVDGHRSRSDTHIAATVRQPNEDQVGTIRSDLAMVIQTVPFHPPRVENDLVLKESPNRGTVCHPATKRPGCRKNIRKSGDSLRCENSQLRRIDKAIVVRGEGIRSRQGDGRLASAVDLHGSSLAPQKSPPIDGLISNFEGTIAQQDPPRRLFVTRHLPPPSTREMTSRECVTVRAASLGTSEELALQTPRVSARVIDSHLVTAHSLIRTWIENFERRRRSIDDERSDLRELLAGRVHQSNAIVVNPLGDIARQESKPVALAGDRVIDAGPEILPALRQEPAESRIKHQFAVCGAILRRHLEVQCARRIAFAIRSPFGQDTDLDFENRAP